jgi:tetratricopeptide (TPR) repeat protein
VRDLLRQLWSLPDTAAPNAITATVQQRLREAGVTSEAETLLLMQVLEVPMDLAPLAALDPQQRKARTFALLRHMIRHASQQQPLVLTVENLHWIDLTSEEWLASLVAQLVDTPVLLLATYRPGYQPPWLGHSSATQMALPRLSQSDSLVVLRSVPQAAQLPVALHQGIVAKAAGNPFFVEELTWAAVAHGAAAGPVPLPDTIEAVLAARIDRLPPEDKRLVQITAVIGTEVLVALVRRLAGVPEDALQRSLAHLQATEFLYEICLFPEQAYTFKHALTHEVAYGSLLRERRRVLHGRLVEALEALAPEQVERLAYHAFRGEMWDKAVTYCQQAGVRADDRAAVREAVAAFEQALQALAHLPQDGDTRVRAFELRLALVGVGGLLTQEEYGRRLALLGEAEALARALDDRVRLARVLAQTGHIRRGAGGHDGAIAVGQQALALAAELGQSALQVRASHFLGQPYAAIGDFGRAVELQRWSMEVADRESGTSSTNPRIVSRAYLAVALSALGAFAEGRRHGEEALRLATLAGSRLAPLIAHGSLGTLYLAQGDLESAIWVLELGLALCRTSGDGGEWLQVILASLGYAAALQGRLAEGRARLEEALSESIRTGVGRAVVWERLSEVCRLAGHGAEAWQHACQEMDLARQRKKRSNEALALHQLGVVQAHAEPSDVTLAEAYYQQALALAEELGMRPLQAHCHRGLGMLYAQTGRRQQARAALHTAIDLYRAMDMTFWLPQAEAMLPQVGEEGQRDLHSMIS